MNASNSEFELNVYVDEVVMIDTKETDLLAREIDHFHRKDEDDKHRLLTDFIKEAKTDLSARMRMILIDWLVEVGEEYKVSSKALHLAICLVDRCLASMTLHRSELQLMGCACMILASKYEDVHAPSVEDLVYISDHTYTGDRMLEMESMVLDALEFRVSSTHLYHFLERFVLAAAPRTASKTALPVQMVAKKLLGLAIKMEAQLFVMTHGRALSEDAIRRHLLYLAGRAFRTRFQTRNHVVKL
ncbi:hypothetical protein SPRG_20992 [Saprolegnia parasitica CBS 223.65]|uniref:Cyclin-like domain-containing protein n=1 Tax=Saprolegnia parasitica (strain CBS 223.65) TaxID=695850 RepID=A0A067C9P6_SAPPC|nr:hypothetical protein SPRG_20992 [Saprolegnia parasitica CBS 223.65]KDO23251.1 hypothetical protein SPRG_20992 [Saprolegnia parasitica CBS 223.65]|eukprot:XP_012206076.1 hypothetical protein SPRG_20992 [Saprolegnia parasitica CBS 223.65]